MKPKVLKNKRFVVVSNHFITIYEDENEDKIVDRFKTKLVEAVYLNESRDSVILKFEKLPNIMLTSNKIPRLFKIVFKINLNEWELAYCLPDEGFMDYIYNKSLPDDEYMVSDDTREPSSAIIRESSHAMIIK